MTVTDTHFTLKAAGLTPTALVEAELDQLERMVEYVTRRRETADPAPLDRADCEKRLRALVQTYDLPAPQRQRVIALLDRLEREAVFRLRRRTALCPS